MVKCSYCESEEHNISSCKEDTELVELIMNHTQQPKFPSMNEKLLRRMSAQYKIKTTMPKMRLIIHLTRKWQEMNKSKKTFTSNDSECAICFETLETTNSCITKCGHKYCLTCILQLSDNHTNKNNVDCPMCRTSLYTKKSLREENYQAMENDNIIRYLEENVINNLVSMRNDLRFINQDNTNNDRTFIYDGNAIPYNNEPTVRDANEPTYIDVDDYLRNDAETTNQFIRDMEIVDELFSEPPTAVEVIREQYRN